MSDTTNVPFIPPAAYVTAERQDLIRQIFMKSDAHERALKVIAEQATEIASLREGVIRIMSGYDASDYCGGLKDEIAALLAAGPQS